MERARDWSGGEERAGVYGARSGDADAVAESAPTPAAEAEAVGCAPSSVSVSLAVPASSPRRRSVSVEERRADQRLRHKSPSAMSTRTASTPPTTPPTRSAVYVVPGSGKGGGRDVNGVGEGEKLLMGGFYDGGCVERSWRVEFAQ